MPRVLIVRSLAGVALASAALFSSACASKTPGTPEAAAPATGTGSTKSSATPSEAAKPSGKPTDKPSDQPADKPTDKPAQSGDEKQVGKAITIKDLDTTGVVTLVSWRTSTSASEGFKPKSGTYAAFRLKLECKSGEMSTNSLYAVLKTPDGKTVEGTDGNAFLATFEPELPLKDIGKGESAEGYVVLDTPVPPGSKLVWLNPLDKPLAEWPL